MAGAITLAEARSAAEFSIGIPSYPEELGEPSAVYLQDLQPGQQLVLVYESRPGLGRQPTDETDTLFTLFQFKTEEGGGERRRLLIEAVGQLKDDDQVVIHMRYFLEFSETEMAAALRCRPGTVWSRISRASRRLKALIESRFPDLAEGYQRD